MGSFWQPRNQPGSKDRIHWNLMLEWVADSLPSSGICHPLLGHRCRRDASWRCSASLATGTVRTSRPPSMLISLRAAISACRSVRVLGSCRCWPWPAATPARRRWRVPSLRLAVINFLLRTATFRHLNGHRRD